MVFFHSYVSLPEGKWCKWGMPAVSSWHAMTSLSHYSALYPCCTRPAGIPSAALASSWDTMGWLQLNINPRICSVFVLKHDTWWIITPHFGGWSTILFCGTLFFRQRWTIEPPIRLAAASYPVHDQVRFVGYGIGTSRNWTLEGSGNGFGAHAWTVPASKLRFGGLDWL